MHLNTAINRNSILILLIVKNIIVLFTVNNIMILVTVNNIMSLFSQLYGKSGI